MPPLDPKEVNDLFKEVLTNKNENELMAKLKAMQEISKKREVERAKTNLLPDETVEEAVERLRLYNEYIDVSRGRDETKDEVIKRLSTLPDCPDDFRIIPNDIVRSSLFGVVRKGRRRYLENELIASFSDVQIRFQGQQLDQHDLDVFSAILYAIRKQKLGSSCYISSYSLLKVLNRSDSGTNRKILEASVMRLVASALVVKTKQYTYIGSLINSAHKKEDSKEWFIAVNPNLIMFFGSNNYTRVNFQIRTMLRGSQLSLWLQSFYVTHARPYPLKVDVLRKLSGSEAMELWKFRQLLIKALEKLKNVAVSMNGKFNYEIIDDFVHIYKEGSKSQQQHIEKIEKSR